MYCQFWQGSGFKDKRRWDPGTCLLTRQDEVQFLASDSSSALGFRTCRSGNRPMYSSSVFPANLCNDAHSQALTMRQESTCPSCNGRPDNIRVLQKDHCRIKMNFNFCSSSPIPSAKNEIYHATERPRFIGTRVHPELTMIKPRHGSVEASQSVQ